MNLFDKLREQFKDKADAKIIYTWETPAEMIAQGEEFPYNDIQAAYAVIQISREGFQSKTLIWSYVASRQEWSRAWSAGPLVDHLLKRIAELEDPPRYYDGQAAGNSYE